MRLRLVPVGDRGQVVGAVVGVAVLDRHLERATERDRVGQVETVDRGLGPGLEILLLEGTAVERALALAHPPGVREIVLRPRPVQGRALLAVHAEDVVALPPPAHGPLEDAQVAADVVAGALGVEDEVGAARVGRELLAVLGVEIRRPLREFRELAVVDVIVERVDGPRSLVGRRDPAGPAERHVPVGVARPPLRGAGDRQRDEIPVQAVADAEEITDGRLDRGLALAVPIRPEDDLAPVERLGGDRHPDVVDGGRPGDLGQHGRPARLDGDRIAVPAAPVVGGDAAACEVLGPPEVLQQVLAGRGRGGQSEKGDGRRARAHVRNLPAIGSSPRALARGAA